MPFQARTRIKELCELKQISLAKLSRLSTVNYNTIYRWANQPIERIDADPLFRICQALECSVDELLERIGDDTIN